MKTISLEPESLTHFDLQPMLRAAVLLADAGVDVIAWNGTSGAWRGLDADLTLCQAITDFSGVQAMTSTLAQLEAFKAFEVRNYALAVPYLETVTQVILPTYAGAGFQCSGWACLGISVNTDFAYVPQNTTRDLVRRCNSSQADAVAIICTNLPAAWLVAEMEAELASQSSIRRLSPSGTHCDWWALMSPLLAGADSSARRSRRKPHEHGLSAPASCT